MKTPKLLAAVPVLTLSASAVIGWSAITRASQTDKTSEAMSSSHDPSDKKSAAMRVKLDRASAKVRDRLHMSCMIEVSDDPAEEAEIAELFRSGWIIEATVEDVEAARQAATATPGLEDDAAAQALAHRASCRFFFKE